MKLEILEPEPRESGPILICDEDRNDIAYFFHNEHATVGQSYETALMLARKLVVESGTAEAEMRLAINAWLKCPAERRPSPQALGQRVAEIAAAFAAEAPASLS